MSPDHTLPASSRTSNVHDGTRSHTPPSNPSMSSHPTSVTPSTPHKNLLSYISPRHHSAIAGHPTPTRTPQSRHGPNMDTRSEIYSLSPVRFGSQQMLLSPRRQPRAVSKVPYKVLDAPELADDFYLNLVDWGSANVLGVGLGSSVYMWNAQTSRVNKLCTLEDDTVTSVSWIQKGTHLAIGTGKGLVQIWDAEKTRRLRTMTGHTARVGSLAWNTHVLTSGSRDRLIYHRDVREPDQWMRKLVGHKQEVCGLKWNCEDGQLASGGNDNKLMVWDKLSETPLWKFSDHTAAVKAIAWSPPPERFARLGRWHGRPAHHLHDTVRGAVINEGRYRQPGVQHRLVQELERDRLDTRLFAKPDRRVEVPVHDSGCQPDWPHLSRPVPGYEPGRSSGCDGCRRRDAPLLERVWAEKRQQRRQRWWRAAVRLGRHPVKTTLLSHLSTHYCLHTHTHAHTSHTRSHDVYTFTQLSPSQLALRAM